MTARNCAWRVVLGTAIATAFLFKRFRMPKARIFDAVCRTDMTGKMRTESSFAYLNRSARHSSAESRTLIETWLSRVPATERSAFCSRFRSGAEVQFTSALQELTLHELLRCQGCKLRFHPNVPGTTKQPDFSVQQPNGSEFLLEACTSTEISSGPEHSPRADRIRDFLDGLDLQGYLIAIDELIEGSLDLPQKLLAKYIDDGIKAGVAGYSKESISIPPITTSDGWSIKLTAFPIARYGTRRGTVLQEAWHRTWSGSSYPLRDSLKKKGGRYGNQFGLPYVIAVNSSDVMLTDRHFEETLFGVRSDTALNDSRLTRGFWGTATAPNHSRVSAVLFTTNLCPPTLLMDQVYACLYLNPWTERPYSGVLTKLPTFRLENGTLKEYTGLPLHKLLKLRLRESVLFRA
jgi:hypothetical protein